MPNIALELLLSSKRMPAPDRLLTLLAEGVDVAREHPNTSYACGIAAALVALPGFLSALC